MISIFYKNIAAYLLKARTVKAEKQPLLGPYPYTFIRGTHHVRCIYVYELLQFS
jgi:hypothetical protein